MLKFVLPGESTTVLGIGLSAENVRRLQAGQPIYVPIEDWLPDAINVGSPFTHVLIVTGDTEQSIKADITAAVDEFSDGS